MLIKNLRKLPVSKLLHHSGVTANLMLTRRCNLRCPYCEVINRNNGIELNTQQWKKIIKNLSNKFINIVFTGGEPLLYDGVEELINYAHQHTFVGLLTNGTLLEEKTMNKFKNLNYLNISSILLFNNKNTSESLLSMLQRFNKKYRTFIASTIVVTPQNCQRVSKIIEMLTKYGIYAEICIIHFRNDNTRYWFRTNNLSLKFGTEEQIIKLKFLQNKLIKMKRAGYLINTPDSYIKGMSNFIENNRVKFRCFAADKFICVNNDGFIMPCQDLEPSNLNALDVENITQIRKLKNLIPEGCNCWLDCAYFYSLLDTRATGTAVKELLFSLYNYLNYRIFFHSAERKRPYELQ